MTKRKSVRVLIGKLKEIRRRKFSSEHSKKHSVDIQQDSVGYSFKGHTLWTSTRFGWTHLHSARHSNTVDVDKIWLNASTSLNSEFGSIGRSGNITPKVEVNIRSFVNKVDLSGDSTTFNRS